MKLMFGKYGADFRVCPGYAFGMVFLGIGYNQLKSYCIHH